jgi:hypothetical protein
MFLNYVINKRKTLLITRQRPTVVSILAYMLSGDNGNEYYEFMTFKDHSDLSQDL